MTVELARRLIESGVPLADIEAALLLVVERGMSLSEALAEMDPRLIARVEQELNRSELPSVLTVRVPPELYGRLPDGMCRRLLAVPVHVDPRSGRVDVAAVEPLDPHIAQEFSYHLEQPVRVLQAPREAVVGALYRLQRHAKISVLPAPAHSGLGSDAPIPLVKVEPAKPSDAPIPLVRRSLSPTRTKSAIPSRGSRPPGALPEAEGVVASWRYKAPPVDLVEGARSEASRAEAMQRSAAPTAPSARERLEEVTTPDAVLEILRDALAPAASIIFAVKSSSFEGRAASDVIERRSPAKKLLLLAHQPSVLESAVKSGFYLGPIPNTPNHRELRDALTAEAAAEVYVTVVTVSDRPSLVWLIAGFEQSLDLTRRADEIALVAGRVLARIVRERKRGT